MEELSWRAKLAKSNVNILNIDEDNNKWYYEFMYRPRPGQIKWSKTFYTVKFTETKPGVLGISYDVIADNIRKEVLELRKELEG